MLFAVFSLTFIFPSLLTLLTHSFTVCHIRHRAFLCISVSVSATTVIHLFYLFSRCNCCLNVFFHSNFFAFVSYVTAGTTQISQTSNQTLSDMRSEREGVLMMWTYQNTSLCPLPVRVFLLTLAFLCVFSHDLLMTERNVCLITHDVIGSRDNKDSWAPG